MKEYLIIGSGFSSYLFSSNIKNKKYQIIAPRLINKEFYNLRKNKFISNKILNKKSISVSNISYNISNKIIFHDFLLDGGCSNIWGGVINLKLIKNYFYIKSLISNFKFIKLSFNNTNTSSNNKNLYQITNKKNEIASFKQAPKKFIDGYLINFNVQKNYIECNYYSFKKKKIITTKCKKLILATGILQLINILISSGYIMNGYKLSLEEYLHFFKISFNDQIKSNDLIVKYNFIGVLTHFFGYQKKVSNFFKYLSFLPIFVNQIFKKKKIKITFIYKNNLIFSSYNAKFGSSAHYNNFKINNVNINSFLKKKTKNLVHVISMPATKQIQPGPISNDIINLVSATLKKFNNN